ncbi:MAG: DNA polymerase III subunit beta [Clostridia bacterium]|nr:DNA polymerase III subunit beta [Clostridia bacterium]
MKFVCSTYDICEAVTNVQRAVSTKSSLPALEGILLKAENNLITMSGYDLEIAITTTCQANIVNEGSVILNARLFGEILKKIPGDKVEIETDNKLSARISSGATEFSIMAMAAEEYPELPAINDNSSIEIDCEILRSMVSQTIFAVSTTDIKPVHTGILFEVDDDNLKLIAVDGYRLAIRNEKIKNSGSMRFIIPSKTLNEIMKLMGEDDKTVKFNIGSRHISFDVGNFLVISRLLEGEFLDYRSAIPQGAATTVVVNTKSFTNSIDRISLLITDRLKSPVRCVFENNEISMRCTTAMGKASDKLECSINGDSLEIGFNNKYFLDALRAVDSDMVKIELNGATSPIKILPCDGDDFLFLVLPVRLKAE